MTHRPLCYNGVWKELPTAKDDLCATTHILHHLSEIKILFFLLRANLSRRLPICWTGASRPSRVSFAAMRLQLPNLCRTARWLHKHSTSNAEKPVALINAWPMRHCTRLHPNLCRGVPLVARGDCRTDPVGAWLPSRQCSDDLPRYPRSKGVALSLTIRRLNLSIHD